MISDSLRKQYIINLPVRIAALLLTLSGLSWLIVQQQWAWLVFGAPLLLWQVSGFYRLHKKAQDEVMEFARSVHYRDFSRHFNVRKAPPELQPLRQGFNEINDTFKDMSREKETQYQYLQKILELVDTGIVSYSADTGEVVWMNESFRKLFAIPYLKTVESLQKRDGHLYEQLLQLRTGDSKVVTLLKDKNPLKVLMTAAAFQTDGKLYKLVAFQNVNEALDETESNAWQRLLGVMTHEIMNSVAPISSLADTLKHRLRDTRDCFPANEPGAYDDLELGIGTIKRRSEGLLKFAETYRSLSKITKLSLSRVVIGELFENLHQLMAPTFAQKGIRVEVILKEPLLAVEADPALIEQVLINLLVNAMEAVKDQPDPLITLSAGVGQNGRVSIVVRDNGQGMPDEILDKIFIPFFSTKKSGSGIGLSLCKQIMMLHKGAIQVQTVLDEGTAFTLQF